MLNPWGHLLPSQKAKANYPLKGVIIILHPLDVVI